MQKTLFDLDTDKLYFVEFTLPSKYLDRCRELGRLSQPLLDLWWRDTGLTTHYPSDTILEDWAAKKIRDLEEELDRV